MRAGSTFPEVDGQRLAWVTAEEMREIDRIVIEDLAITLPQMMENAGRTLAELVVRRFAPTTATVLCGTGGNGGGGIVAARHLSNRGVGVALCLSGPPEALDPVPRRQLEAAHRIGVPVKERPVAADVVLDALLGYGARGDPRGRLAELVSWAGDGSWSTCSLDVPSGLDPTTGVAGSPAIAAAATLTLAMPKTGLRGRPERTGELYLGDISVPPMAFERIGKPVGTPFADGQLIRIR